MFALFFSLYYSMFMGYWQNITIGTIREIMLNVSKEVGTFLTSIFGDVQMTDFGTILFGVTTIGQNGFTNYMALIAFVLALITSIGIVVVAVKGVKRAFGIFFGQIR